MGRGEYLFGRRTIFTLCVCLCIALCMDSSGGEPDVRWASVVEMCEDAGIPLDSILATIRICANARMSADKAMKIMEPVCMTKNDLSMHVLLLEKIEEGIAKNADTGAIVSAIEERRQAVIKAKRIISYNRKTSNLPHGVLASVTYVMEAGLPAPAVTAIMQHGKNLSDDKLKAAVETAEMLCLTGIDEKETTRIVFDYIDGKLKTADIREIVKEFRGREISEVR